MRVAFWNRLKSAPAKEQAAWLLEGCESCAGWDVLVLAEVTRPAAATFRAVLADVAVVTDWTEHVAQPTNRRPHGLLLAARHGLEIRDVWFPAGAAGSSPKLDDHLVAEARKRKADAAEVRRRLAERWIAATIEHRGSTVTVAGAQVPYAAGRNLGDTLHNRLAKRETYRQLSDWLAAQDGPVVVGLDGNNWGDWIDSAAEDRPDPTKRYRDPARRLLDEAKVFDLEKSFHGPSPSHGLADTLRSAHLAGRFPDGHESRSAAQAVVGEAEAPSVLGMTHRLAGRAPRMDRIYASPMLPVRSAGICHGTLDAPAVMAITKGTKLCVHSDHALVWADLALPT